ncbi:MAG: ATP-binding protein, partial [Nitrospira sp.]|nr:ATP-binding protein [Nitrospira sp.]
WGNADKDLRCLFISEIEIDEFLKKPMGFPELDQGSSPSLPKWVEAKIEEISHRNVKRKRESVFAGISLRLRNCQENFKLCEFETDVLLLGIASEVNQKYERIFGYLHDDITRKRPSVEIALHLFCQTLREKIEARQYFLPGSALFGNFLMLMVDDPNQPHQPLLSRTLKVEDRLVEYLLGTDETILSQDGIFDVKNSPLTMEEVPIPENLKEAIGRWINYPTDSVQPILYFQGPPGVGKQTTAEAFFQARGLKTLVIHETAWMKNEGFSLSTGLPVLIREAKLQGAGILWVEGDGMIDGERDNELQTVLRKVCEQRVPIIITGHKTWEFTKGVDGQVFLRYEFPRPGCQQRLAHWRKLSGLPEGEKVYEFLEEVANRYRFTYGQIQEGMTIVRNIALRRNPKRRQISQEDIYEACRLNSNRKLHSLAQHINPRYSWKDIVLPEERLSQLYEVVRFVKYRGIVYDEWGFEKKLSLGKGVNALFSGPSGTGKTMAAEVIAQELELDMYKIDLAKIVSKYIGETEKNLSRIFEEAGSSNAILFFDEADALFGRRSEVKDSHDRYANIEVGYLLQKMEDYEGIVILGTNFRKNLDEAFVRRMHTTIEFPFPDEKERRKIWEKIWPEATPLNANVDLDFMAKRFPLTGGNIKNIAVASSFLALENGREVMMKHLLQATRREFQKMGKVLGDEEKVYADSVGMIIRP